MIVKEKDKYNFIVADVEPKKTDRVTTSIVDVSEIQGRVHDKDHVMRKLIVEQDCGVSVVSIVGTGGIGKTTLAQMVYNDDLVKKCFTKIIWICVSDVSDQVKIAKEIILKVNGSSPDHNDLDLLLQCVTDSISRDKFLLVLDDVWEEYCTSTKWELLKISLKKGAPPCSKILVTTRSEMVAKKMGTTEDDIHLLGVLSDEDCWLLMSRIAFYDRPKEERQKLEHTARKIANKCKGLPLAAKVVGSVLRFKHNMQDWENVLDSEIWQLEKAEVEIFPHLYLSYNELSPEMKLCFSYCAVFPKDYEIDIENLIRMWMAQGYLSSGGNMGDLELKGKEYFNILKVRSFFQDFREGYNGRSLCKMHDIVHDFAQFLRKNKTADAKVRGGAKPKELSEACNPSMVSHIQVYRSLICEENVSHFTHLFKSNINLLRVLECEDTIPTGLENLTQLRYLAINYHWRHSDKLHVVPQTIFKLYNLETLTLSRMGFEEIPTEIGNLIKLRHLDLSNNTDIKELPETIYNLRELRTLNLNSCSALVKIPEGIEKLVNLKHLINAHTYEIKFPEGLEQLTRLETLSELCVGRGYNSKLGYLNKLDNLSGYLSLEIRPDADIEDMIEEANKARLEYKIHLQRLTISFDDEMRRTDDETESMRNELMEALKPHPYLSTLWIHGYKGNKFPGWMSSSSSPIFNHLKKIQISYCSTLPTTLGKLPCMEQLVVSSMYSLELVGREFMGITSSSSSSSDIENIALQSSSSSSHDDHVLICFPKLQKLEISSCFNWKEWEDITAEEEEGRSPTVLSIMPCLIELRIEDCYELKKLPHRLLRYKASSSLKYLDIRSCKQLYESYSKDKDKEGSDWNSLISLIPVVRVI